MKFAQVPLDKALLTNMGYSTSILYAYETLTLDLTLNYYTASTLRTKTTQALGIQSSSWLFLLKELGWTLKSWFSFTFFFQNLN